MVTAKKKTMEEQPAAVEQETEIATTEEQAGEQESNKVESPNKDTLIYCGPSLPNGLLSRFVVFRGGLPTHLDKYLTACPALTKLFVPLEAFADTQKALETVGSAESYLFEEVKKHFYGGGSQ